jgi:tetratricopeptide (TPR) repeat protein
MAKDNVNAAPNSPPPEPTPQEKAKAAKWFTHGRTVAETHNYDYAIECFVNGLRVWPEAVDDGHKPLRAVGFARHGAGKKKPGMMETLKFQTMGTGRDALEAMLTSETLLAKDPTNLNYMESMLRSAAKGCYEHTCRWLGPIMLQEALTSPKAHQAKIVLVMQVFEELAEKYSQRGDAASQVECLQLAAKAVEVLVQLKPDDGALQDRLRNIGGKMAITKGKFEVGDFRESLHEGDRQRELRDQERMHQDEEQYGKQIEAARKELEGNPDEPGKVAAVKEWLLRRGRPEDEDEAIQLLRETYARTKAYLFKLQADDIRIRQLRREAQQVKAQGDRQAAQKHLQTMLDFEIEVCKERIQRYPTEGRYKYELGKRYFLAQRFDEAVPVLQQARSDAKNRYACLSLMAQCFYHKGYYDQATNILADGIRTYEIPADDTSKEMHYWLGRSYEAAGQREAAIQAYGQIIQWDYNYRQGDVRQRLEALQQAKKSEGDSLLSP